MNIRIVSLLVLSCSIFFFTSCEKENYDEIVYDAPTYEPAEYYENSPIDAVTSGNNDAVALGCVKVNFPFSLKLENDRQLTVNGYNEFTSAMNSTESKVLDF